MEINENLTGLRNRGVQDILIAVVDGLKGFGALVVEGLVDVVGDEGQTPNVRRSSGADG